MHERDRQTDRQTTEQYNNCNKWNHLSSISSNNNAAVTTTINTVTTCHKNSNENSHNKYNLLARMSQLMKI